MRWSFPQAVPATRGDSGPATALVGEPDVALGSSRLPPLRSLAPSRLFTDRDQPEFVLGQEPHWCVHANIPAIDAQL